MQIICLRPIPATSSSAIPPVLFERARSIAVQHDQLSDELQKGYNVDIAKHIGQLSATARAFREIEAARKSLLDLNQLLQDPSTDSDLHSLAAEEIDDTSKSLSSLSKHLQSSLIPQHPFANLPCLIELRPGAGGSEAGLFAGDLLRMYQGFCKRLGIRTSIIKLETNAGTGSTDEVQEAVLEVDSRQAYDLLRCEAGVHRVQRVPATENKGRTHTSAVSVLVLPSFPETGNEELGTADLDDPNGDYYVNPQDVRIDVMRARGAGGQHVNTTDSAVRLTHLPTNTVVAVQDERSQHKNRQKAWRILRSRLAQARREAREEEKAQLRTSVVGVARMGRGDKIRTYNWNQQRVTDHRSGITLHNLDDILEGGQSLEEVMDSVKSWLRERDVETLVADEEAAKTTQTNAT
ncbi:MAG: hypothetical protein Q9190_004506 [Brigantiaea leucoxantha]